MEGMFTHGEPCPWTLFCFVRQDLSQVALELATLLCLLLLLSQCKDSRCASAEIYKPEQL